MMDSENEVKIILEDEDDINITIQEENALKLKLDDSMSVIVNEDHSKLDNLDYESSGHKGFASRLQLDAVNERVNLMVPKRLALIPDLPNNADRKRVYLYVDNNGNDGKIAVSTMLGNLLRKGDSIPNDMQPDEYLFLEIKED